MKKNGLRLFVLGLLTFLFAGSSFAAVPNLSGRWSLNSNQNNVANDSSGNNLDGLVSGTTLVSGRYGKAYNFSGSTDAVHVANDFLLEPTNISVEAWVNSSGSPGIYRYVVSKGASADLAASYGLYTGSTGGLIFYISDGTNFPSSISPDAGTTVWNGEWHHVTGTYDGTTVRLYVDGVEVGNGNAATAPLGYGLSDGNDLLIGSYAVLPDSHVFTGSIDEVRVWSRALTAEEVSKHAFNNSVSQDNNTSPDQP